MKYRCGEFTFPTKRAAIEAVRQILQGAPLARRFAGREADLIRAVFDMHPARDEKLAGFALDSVAFTVREVELPYATQRCFYVERPDGAAIDFSFRVALGLAPQTPQVAEAARAAVAETIVAYKLERFAGRDVMPYDATGVPVAFADAHVDHAGPFAAIVRAPLSPSMAYRAWPIIKGFIGSSPIPPTQNASASFTTSGQSCASSTRP